MGKFLRMGSNKTRKMIKELIEEGDKTVNKKL